MFENTITLKHLTIRELQDKIELYRNLVNFDSLAGVEGAPMIYVQVRGHFSLVREKLHEDDPITFTINTWTLVSVHNTYLIPHLQSIKIRPIYNNIADVQISVQR